MTEYQALGTEKKKREDQTGKVEKAVRALRWGDKKVRTGKRNWENILHSFTERGGGRAQPKKPNYKAEWGLGTWL